MIRQFQALKLISVTLFSGVDTEALNDSQVSFHAIFRTGHGRGAQIGAVKLHSQLPVRTVRSPVATLYFSDSWWQLVGDCGGSIICPGHVVAGGFDVVVELVGVGRGTVPMCRVWLEVVNGRFVEQNRSKSSCSSIKYLEELDLGRRGDWSRWLRIRRKQSLQTWPHCEQLGIEDFSNCFRQALILFSTGTYQTLVIQIGKPLVLSLDQEGIKGFVGAKVVVPL